VEAPSATTLLVRIAASIGCRGGTRALGSLLSKPVRGSEFERRDLAEAIAFFARKHATGDEARELAFLLRRANLHTPTATVVLLARAAATQGTNIIAALNILLPELVGEDRFLAQGSEGSNLATLKRFWANTLVDILGPAQAFRLALQAQDLGVPEIREAITLIRLGVSIKDGQAHLRDRLTSAMTMVDVSDFRKRLLETPASVAVNDKLIAATGVDLVITEIGAA
jgi:hypothetical protein